MYKREECLAGRRKTVEVLIGEIFLVFISENPLRQSLRKKGKKHLNLKSYNLFPTIPFRQLVFSVGDINRSRVTHPRVSMPMNAEKPNKLIQNSAIF